MHGGKDANCDEFKLGKLYVVTGITHSYFRCNGTSHLVDLKEEVRRSLLFLSSPCPQTSLLGADAAVGELEPDDKFHQEMTGSDISRSSRCSFEGKLQQDPQSQVE